MRENNVSITGTCTADPELRFTSGGTAAVKFSIAFNTSKKTDSGWEDLPPQFFEVQCWGQLAENVVESIGKGLSVHVTGQLEQQSWVTEGGDKRSKVQIKANDVQPSLLYATAQVSRNQRKGADDAPADEPKAKAKVRPQAAPVELDDGETF